MTERRAEILSVEAAVFHERCDELLEAMEEGALQRIDVTLNGVVTAGRTAARTSTGTE